MTKNDATPPVALEDREGGGDARLYSPSAARNRDAVRDAVAAALPQTGKALEIGSGTGEHVVAFAAATPGLVWTPSDPDGASRASIAAWIDAEGLKNVRASLAVDVMAPSWGVEAEAPFDAIVSLNMIHIAPWEAGVGLITGAGRLLRPGGVLFLYGPFSKGGVHTAPSNAAFDASLKARDPRWGVRDIDDLTREATLAGLTLREETSMPANNLSLAFVKGG